MSQQLPPNFMPWNPEEIKPVQKRRLKPGAKAVFICLLVILLAAVFLYGGLFRVRTVTVVGLQGSGKEEMVMESAGITRGMSYFSVTEKSVQQKMAQNHYLKYRGMEKFLPGTVVLYVEERVARANVHVMGVTFLMDENGMVLERLTGGLRDDLPVASGLQARDVTVGKTIASGTEDQLTAYCLLMDELLHQGYLHNISELKVSDTESIYLLTRDGYTVHLGDTSSLRAKIGTVRAVVQELKNRGLEGGVLEASVPAQATYTPNAL